MSSFVIVVALFALHWLFCKQNPDAQWLLSALLSDMIPGGAGETI